MDLDRYVVDAPSPQKLFCKLFPADENAVSKCTTTLRKNIT